MGILKSWSLAFSISSVVPSFSFPKTMAQGEEKSTSPKAQAKSQKQISNKGEIEKLIEKVIKENAKAVADYKSGEKNALNFLIGQVMKLSNKRADFVTTKTILEKKLG